ncbi:AAA family ATPase [Ferruginibacter paludis]|uniref:AAA family ATPase n=1 Tax=Ferruginibacter paludis TaxID=1310417 RepID=UPI0025B4A415|nr:AAA family ATPase [Ferruginibacter paludis]MDN3654873.1 AAA family ATPase [Ferruginibacter paludis]
MSDEIIKNLLEALEVSPENVPLRLQVAGMLMAEKKYDEATRQYQDVLQRSYGNAKAQAGLAAGYYYQQKYSAAIIVYEQMQNDMGIADQVLYIKSLIKEGSMEQALNNYQQVLALNPGFTDEEIDSHLRMPSAGNSMDDDLDFLDDEEYLMEKPSLRFKDVGGMEKVKEEISIKIIQPLKNPELYKAFGKKSGGGILLYGPPGCGKTFIAKATAGEIDAKFISIGLHDILDMWIGNSEKNLHEIFEMARRNKPCVLFFDEVDAMGASRSDLKQSAMRHVINQFLAELDGVSSDNEGVLVLAATNAPWGVDAAFRRPGRFDRIIFVAPPDEAARINMLQTMLQAKPVGEIDVKKIAAATTDYSGADLNAVIDIAVEEKLRESMSKGSIQVLTTKDLLSAVKQHKPTTSEWFASARNYALYSNESGLYDDILKYLKIKK